jgi:aminopeptidase YwaD
VPGSPGANDNASGTAVILEMARRLPEALRKQIWFVSFDAEEDGLFGSAAFVADLPTAEIPKIKAMLNFDMVGVNNALAVGGSSNLINVVRGIDPKIGRFNDFAGSDHASFIAEGIPAVFFWRGYEPNYHLPSDTTVDPKLLEEVVQIGLETVRRLL